MPDVTAYTVLGVPRSATQDEIAAAYRARARENHPDRGGDARKMARVNLAWEKLGAAEARAAYDRKLAEIEQGTARAEPAESSTDGEPCVDALLERLKQGESPGVIVGCIARESGLIDAAAQRRIEQAAEKGGQIAREVADLIGLVRGH